MSSSNPPSNSDDLIDSRDVIARVEELRGAIELASAERRDEDGAPIPLSDATLSDLDEMRAELSALEALTGDASGYAPDWRYGCALVRDSYFEEYARELADDLGLTPEDSPWPFSCIDWEQAAKELKQDYTAVEFDGVTYWVR